MIIKKNLMILALIGNVVNASGVQMDYMDGTWEEESASSAGSEFVDAVEAQDLEAQVRHLKQQLQTAMHSAHTADARAIDAEESVSTLRQRLQIEEQKVEGLEGQLLSLQQEQSNLGGSLQTAMQRAQTAESARLETEQEVTELGQSVEIVQVEPEERLEQRSIGRSSTDRSSEFLCKLCSFGAITYCIMWLFKFDNDDRILFSTLISTFLELCLIDQKLNLNSSMPPVLLFSLCISLSFLSFPEASKRQRLVKSNILAMNVLLFYIDYTNESLFLLLFSISRISSFLITSLIRRQWSSDETFVIRYNLLATLIVFTWIDLCKTVSISREPVSNQVSMYLRRADAEERNIDANFRPWSGHAHRIGD